MLVFFENKLPVTPESGISLLFKISAVHSRGMFKRESVPALSAAGSL